MNLDSASIHVSELSLASICWIKEWGEIKEYKDWTSNTKFTKSYRSGEKKDFNDFEKLIIDKKLIMPALSKMNQDIKEERDKVSFDLEEFTNWYYKGADKVEEKRFLGEDDLDNYLIQK